MRQPKMRKWQVRYLDLSVIAPGRTASAACRWAFRKWISDKAILRNPPTAREGGWRGVTATVITATGHMATAHRAEPC